MSSIDHQLTGHEYWRSLEQRADALQGNEFPDLAVGSLDETSRRHFLKIMGASLALAGLTGCRRWPTEKVAPYAHRPEGRTPGVPERYATAMELDGVACGLLVTSFDGRPIKIEGNPSHPASGGAASAFAQASVLELYDPDRSRSPINYSVSTGEAKTEVRTWDDFAGFARAHFDMLRPSGGVGLAVLSEATSSPSAADMKSRFSKIFSRATWYEYEPLSRDNERDGARLAFGEPARTHLHLDKADIIVCLDADILCGHPNALKYARDWAAGRASADDGRMNRLYAVESTYSVTGGAADHRLAILSSQVASLAALLRQKISQPNETLSPPAEWAPFIELLVEDLLAHRGRSVLVAGPAQPPEVHAAVHEINSLLGNMGKTVSYTVDPESGRPSHVAAIKSLAGDMLEGKVDTLVILGGNPVYDAPADVKFADALSKVTQSIHLSLYDNETSKRCTWHLPRAHYLESWSDARSWDGTISVVQPLIQPLHSGKSTIELLALLLNEQPAEGYDIVRRTFAHLLPTDNFEKAWRRVLHDGLLADSNYEKFTATKPNNVAADLGVGRVSALSQQLLEVVFRKDASVYDGRFANNGWLQEMPDPMTRLTWDNAALISVADAKRLNIKTGDVLLIVIGGNTVEIAAYVMPGQVVGSITLPLGYGRSAGGNVGNNVGVNTYDLRTTGAMWFATEAEATPTGKTYKLACTQDHHAIDTIGAKARTKRAGVLIRETTLGEYQRDPKYAHKMGHLSDSSQLWEDPLKYGDHRWGLAIDLTRCTGCGACAVACQAENNIPVVGKDEVAVGRHMNWIRIDRYFKGDPDDPSPAVAHQPVMCHHCENAPCEQVCPVAATVHDTEGLNVMAYNRCIGTRYCSNNCPYKVRRFNFFDYHSKPPHASAKPWLGMPDSQQQAQIDQIKRMAFNPEVTVRMRGVMEKCTYCVQRIQAAKIAARNEKRTLADGDIIPACSQTCPTAAIVFGDLNDADSHVRKLQQHDRAYAMLAELDVRPRTKYLARIKNPADVHENQSEAPT